MSAAIWSRSPMDAPARSIDFKWGSAEIALNLDEAGSGPSVVLLPAVSSISTRKEMRPLFDRLAPDFHVSTVDWPGFGDRVGPKHDLSPAILSAFLDWLLNEIVSPPHRVIAAGHAATYALYQAAHRPGSIASVRFVTGALDRVASREEFLELVRRANVPIFVI